MVIFKTERKRLIMNNPVVNRKQRFFTFRLPFQAGVALLLVMLVLGALGQWDLAVTLVAMVILLSLIVLVSSTMLQVNRDSGSDDNIFPLPFSPYTACSTVWSILVHRARSKSESSDNRKT